MGMKKMLKHVREVRNKDDNWYCTKCMWSGKYKETIPVMYNALDWQNCPSCTAIAIPVKKNE